MDESALHQRLTRIERRQSVLLTLLVGVYLLAGLWVLVEGTQTVTIWNASAVAVGLGVLGAIVGIARRRGAT